MHKHSKQTLIAFEEKVKEAFLQKKIRGPIHLSGGNEEQLLGIFSIIRPCDWVVSTHRNHYHYLLKGGSEEELMRRITHGHSMHIFDKSINFISTAIVGGGIPISVGIARGIKMGRVWCFIGDGAVDSGRILPAVRYATNHNLPLTYVIENNNKSCDTTIQQRWQEDDCILSDTLTDNEHIITYDYERTVPHTGCGRWVSF